jgi:hypothetical protein
MHDGWIGPKAGGLECGPYPQCPPTISGDYHPVIFTAGWLSALSFPGICQNSAAPWWIFSSNKSVPANWKKGFYTSRLRKIEEIGGICVFSGSKL